MNRRVKIYKEDGLWIVDIRATLDLLRWMHPQSIHLIDGKTVGRWIYGTWAAAHKSIFGPLDVS